MEGLERIIREHPFFAGLNDAFVKLISGCAKNVRFEEGQYLFHQGEFADQFYVVRAGRVALQINSPQQTITIQTVGENEIVGASWLVAPYRWSFDARPLELVRALAFDAACLRGKCDEDHELCYELLKRFTPILIQRLQATRLQILDVYGTKR